MKRTSWLGLMIVGTAIVVAFAGFLSSGYKSSDLTVSPEGAPVIDVEDAMTYEGWQFQYGAWEGDIPVPTKYRSVAVNFSVDDEIVKSYEKQGYKVEYGIIGGVGTADKNSESPIVYNRTSKLAVKNVDGVLTSATENATVFLAYSSDKEAEVVDIITNTEDDMSAVVNLRAVIAEFNPFIPVAGDETLDTETYVAAGFIRLTDSKGKVYTEYIPAREMLNVAPVELGDYE